MLWKFLIQHASPKILSSNRTIAGCSEAKPNTNHKKKRLKDILWANQTTCKDQMEEKVNKQSRSTKQTDPYIRSLLLNSPMIIQSTNYQTWVLTSTFPHQNTAWRIVSAQIKFDSINRKRHHQTQNHSWIMKRMNQNQLKIPDWWLFWAWYSLWLKKVSEEEPWLVSGGKTKIKWKK